MTHFVLYLFIHFQIKWFKDDNPVYETSRVRFVKEGDKIGLLIIHAKPSDAGNYKVILTNMFGQSTSSAVLSVDGKQQFFLLLEFYFKENY